MSKNPNRRWIVQTASSSSFVVREFGGLTWTEALRIVEEETRDGWIAWIV